MKRFVLLISIFSSTIGYSQSVDVQFRIKDFPDTTVYVGYYFGNQKYVLDTLSVRKDAFALKREEVKPGLYFLYTPNYFLEFILHPGTYELATAATGGYKDLKVRGSEENELFRDFQLTLGALQKEQQSLIAQVKNGNAADSIAAVQRLDAIDSEMTNYKGKLKEQHPTTFLVAFLNLMDRPDVPLMDSITNPEQRNLARYLYFKAHYFDNVALSDARLLRTPLLHDRVLGYFDQAIIQTPDSINRALDEFFPQLRDNPELFRYWLVTLFKKYTEAKIMGMDAVTIHMIETFYLTDHVDWITEDYRKKLIQEVTYVKPNLIGNLAPPLHVVDVNLRPFVLEKVLAPYTLLFIYDPDCGHCKKAVKELIAQEQDLKKHHVQIVAICTTTEVDKWRTFISENNPEWIHAIDPRGQSNFRVSYDVRTTPKIYLLDKDKYIITKQLSIDQVVGFLNHTGGVLEVQEE